MKTYSMDGDQVYDLEEGWIENPHRPESWHDRVWYSRPQIITGVGRCQSISIQGFWDAAYFDGWPGVAYSPAKFQMKALQAADGRIFRPSAGRTGYAVEVTAPIPENCITRIAYRQL